MPAYKTEFERGDTALFLLHLLYPTRDLHSREVEAALRTEIARFQKECDADILASAWYYPNESDEELLPLPDGSQHILFRRSDGALILWKDYLGSAKDTKETEDYFYIVETSKTAEGIKPEKAWLSISLLLKQPTPALQLYAHLVSVGKEWVDVGQEIHIHAFYGEKSNRISWQQVRDTDGKYVWIDYLPQKRAFIRDGYVIESLDPTA